MTHSIDGSPITGVYRKVEPADWRVIVIDGEPYRLEDMQRAVLCHRFEQVLSLITDYPAALDEHEKGYRLTTETVEITNAVQLDDGKTFQLIMSDGSMQPVPAGLLRTLISE